MNKNPLGGNEFIRQCARKHCASPARSALVLRVPVKDTPPGTEPVRIVIREGFCPSCANRSNVGEFLARKSVARKMILAHFKASGFKPNFPNASLAVIDIDGEEYQRRFPRKEGL